MKLKELMEQRLSAAQKKAIATQVKKYKESDGRVKRSDLEAAEAAAEDESYGSSEHELIRAVNDEIFNWSKASRTEYQELKKDIEKIESEEHGAYLFDEGVDRENVLVDGRTEDSVDFWPMMVSAAKSSVGQRAEELGININKRLGRVIY